MKTTKSGSTILGRRETIDAELREVRKAQEILNKQKAQLNKRLYYVPYVMTVLWILWTLTAMYGLVRLSWYVTGESNVPSVSCLCKTCELPKTGA